jgi:hypothetical protein
VALGELVRGRDVRSLFRRCVRWTVIVIAFHLGAGVV